MILSFSAFTLCALISAFGRLLRSHQNSYGACTDIYIIILDAVCQNATITIFTGYLHYVIVIPVRLLCKPTVELAFFLCGNVVSEIVDAYDMSRHMTKPTKWHLRPAKTQISLGIRPDWIRVFTVRSIGSAQCFFMWTAKTLIRLGGCWAHMPFRWFCHEAAHVWKETSTVYVWICNTVTFNTQRDVELSSFHKFRTKWPLV